MAQSVHAYLVVVEYFCPLTVYIFTFLILVVGIPKIQWAVNGSLFIVNDAEIV